MLTTIRRIFYSRSSEIIGDIVRLHLDDPVVNPSWHSGNRLNPYTIFYLCIASFLIVRMATFTIVCFALETPEFSAVATTYLSTELNSGLFYKHLIQERLTGALMVPYCVNNFAILAFVMLIPNKNLWFFVNDYLINNGAHFWAANPHLKIYPLDLLKNPFQSTKKVFRILEEMWWRASEGENNNGFSVNFRNPLAYQPNYSHQTRSRTLLLHLFMEIVFFFVQIIAGINSLLKIHFL